MQLRYAHHLDNLSLQNINSKLQNLRDELREQTNQDAQFIRYKMTTSLDNGTSSHQEEHQESDEDPANTNHPDQHLSITGLPIHTKNQQEIAAQLSEGAQAVPTSYKNIKLLEQEIDYEEVKRINNKKVSADFLREYIKETLPDEVEEKMKQVWEQLEDDQNQVNFKNFVRRFNKLGIKFTQAQAFYIPLIKKIITLKKVLFQFAFKEENMPQTITWQEFKEFFSTYTHLADPSMDILVKNLQKEGNKLPSNSFHIPVQVIQQLKSIYKKCFADQFLGYCSCSALISKLQSSMILQKYAAIDVRPKTHLDVSLSLKNVINYIKNKAPLFVDLDQFLLYFSIKPSAFYPIQERECLDKDSTLNPQSKQQKLNRIKSNKEIKTKKSSSPRKNVYNEYMMSFNVPRCAQKTKKPEETVYEEESEIQQPEKFKARPFSKTKSEEKYKQFIQSLQAKKQQRKEKQEENRIRSEREIQRLKSQTKLFQKPQHTSPQLKKEKIVPRPAPEACLSPRLKEIQADKEERKKKILSLTNEKYKYSWQQLPKVANLQRESPQKQQKPQIHEYYKQSHEVPDYKSEQQRMKLQLQLKKAHFKPTQFKQFYFHTQARHPHQYQQKIEEVKGKQTNYDYKKILYSPEPDIYYTQKFTDMVISNKNYAVKRQLSLNQKIMEQQERQKKHKNFAKFMKGPLAKLPNTAKICEIQAKTKIQRHKKYWKNLDRQYQEGLNEIYSKVIKRPFLYEMQRDYRRPYANDLPKFEIPQKKKTKKKKANKTVLSAQMEVNKSF